MSMCQQRSGAPGPSDIPEYTLMLGGRRTSTGVQTAGVHATGASARCVRRATARATTTPNRANRTGSLRLRIRCGGGFALRLRHEVTEVELIVNSARLRHRLAVGLHEVRFADLERGRSHVLGRQRHKEGVVASPSIQ